VRALFALLLVFLLAACVPSRTMPPVPPAATPFVISDGRFVSGDLMLGIPQGWRVVTSEASAPLVITLVSPDECGVIVVSSAPLAEVVRAPACGDVALRGLLRTVEIGGARYALSASAPAAAWGEMAAAVAQVVGG
jgi:hypothetical protein